MECCCWPMSCRPWVVRWAGWARPRLCAGLSSAGGCGTTESSACAVVRATWKPSDSPSRFFDEEGILAIFPEGTRSPSGAMQEAKEGAGVLAARSGAPILPIAIIGSQRFWAKGARLPRPGRRMIVRVGETFKLSIPKGGDRHESLRLATVEMMGHVAALLPPEQRGVYADAVK